MSRTSPSQLPEARRARYAERKEAINAARRARYAEDATYREACKVAAAGRRAGYTDEQREAAYEQIQAWKAANPEKVREHNARGRARYAKRHPGRSAESQRAYAERGGDGYRAKKAAQKRREREQHPDRVRDRERIHGSARRAKCKTIIHPLIVLELADGVCGICGEDVDPLDFHVDHIIPLARGGEHSYDNTQPACPPCNLRKGAKLIEEDELCPA